MQERGEKVRNLIRNAELPEELIKTILEAYSHLEKQYGKLVDVAVRSSATAEDLPDASFAGQQETYLNIKGGSQLIDSCKKCFASLFTNRAISYRKDKHFDHFSIGLSIGVQKMVRSDLATSGVMFSIDTESGFKNAVLLTAAYGLGETVVQGSVNPDEYYIFKPTLRENYKPIISKKVGSKKIKMIYDNDGNKNTKIVPVPKEQQQLFALEEEEILTLAKWAVIIEDHYSKKAGYFKPMDMEWAKDGKTGELFIVQARPETVQSRKDSNKLINYVLKEDGRVIVNGKSVGEKIGYGRCRIIKDVKDIDKFQEGEVLVTDMTDPDWEPIMKIAAGIVTNRGGRTCHASIVSRELGIPCIVGTEKGTEEIKSGTDITVDCSKGEIGRVLEGLLEYKIEETDLKEIPDTKTHIMLNIGNPDMAFDLSFLPNDGVGLAREEFIINDYIKIHPLALINYEEQEQDVKQKIDGLTYGYSDKSKFFIDKLAQGVGMLAAAFYPKPVIVRLSDFKTNEYANLIGGTNYEPEEDNPMIGWRGASRYYSEGYKDAFGLECKAMKIVRERFGLKNLKLMIPFCRTVEEAKNVIKKLNIHKLKSLKYDVILTYSI